MQWVQEREEWLIDWGDAKCLKEVTVASQSGSSIREVPADSADVFFSDVLQVGERCVVCRVNGADVEIFDISPDARSLLSWRVHLPGPVLADIGVSHACLAEQDSGPGCAWLLLLAAHDQDTVIHRVRIDLGRDGVADVVVDGQPMPCALGPSAVSSFCALGPDWAAVGCFDGALHAFCVHPGGKRYELADSSLLRRLSGLAPGFAPARQPILALALVGARHLGGAGRLLSLCAGGSLRLWEVLETGSRALSSQELFAAPARGAASAEPAFMRVSPSQDRACVLLPGGAVYVVDLQDGLRVVAVNRPFEEATPSLVALSDGALWSFWSSPSRTQLFRLGLEEDQEMSHAGLAFEDAALRHLVMEGCNASNHGGYFTVFTLYQQQEVWRAEEEGFDVEALASRRQGLAVEAELSGPDPYLVIADQDAAFEDLVLEWWMSRLFIPGRYSKKVIMDAMEEQGGRPSQELKDAGPEALRLAVEDHIRKQLSMQSGRSNLVDFEATHLQFPLNSPLRAAGMVATLSAELVRTCTALWQTHHQVCGMGTSGAWCQHAWHVDSGNRNACPMLLCRGGVSCIRAVQSWPERWWVTLHLTRSMSNYDRIDIDQVLGMSDLDEWKICNAAWFLSQCVGRSAQSNLCMSLGLSRRSETPSSIMRRFALSVTEHVGQHMEFMLESMQNRNGQGDLRNIRHLVEDYLCSHPMSRDFEKLQGASSGIAHSDVCLADVFRGRTSLSECEYLCAVLRDLLLLCTYATESEASPGVFGGVGREWAGLRDMLDVQLPLFVSLYQSAGIEVKRTCDNQGGVFSGQQAVSVLRPTPFTLGCDLWASMLRGSPQWQGQRVPTASFASVRFALVLLRQGCWDALRLWARHQTGQGRADPFLAAFVAYLHGCESLSHRRFEAAHKSFMRAETECERIVDLLQHCSMLRTLQGTTRPPIIAYSHHVGSLFGAHGQSQEQYFFARRAAHMTDDRGVDEVFKQLLWCSVVELAIELELWDDAQQSLERVDNFERYLRLMGDKLRRSGSIGLMLKLPEKHLASFFDSLHETASMGLPTQGSDALACFQLLYALHFSGGHHLKAAAVAHTLYTALARHLAHTMPDRISAPESTSALLTGDCNAQLADVPGWSSAVRGSQRQEDALGFTYNAMPEAMLPMLEQQRGALLMFVTALSLTKERVLVVPREEPLKFGGPRAASNDEVDVSGIASASLKDLQAWFSQADQKASEAVLSVEDVQGLLAVVEARLLAMGRSDLGSPLDVARSAASLGHLGLAISTARAQNLDLWHAAFQPFVSLCVELEHGSPEKANNLVQAARGPSQAHMFVSTDSSEPLGSDGAIPRGLWTMLAEALVAVGCKSSADAGAEQGLDASSVRLHSLVLDEIFARDVSGECAQELIARLKGGPSWVSVLRLYMKHGLEGDAVELFREQLGRHASFGPNRLQDFPASLAVQLRRHLESGPREAGSDPQRFKELGSSMDDILARYRSLLHEFARGAEAR